MSVQICSDATWPMISTTGGEKKSACPWCDFMRGVSCFTPRGNVSVSMTDATKQDSKISRFNFFPIYTDRCGSISGMLVQMRDPIPSMLLHGG